MRALNTGTCILQGAGDLFYSAGRFEGPCEACDAFTLDSALLNQAGKCLNRHRDSACFTGLSSRRLLLPLFCSVGPCLDGASGPVLCRLAMLG